MIPRQALSFAASMINRRQAWIATMFLALSVAACGQSSPSGTPAAAPTASPAATETPTPSTEATIAPLPTVVDTGTAGTPPCAVADLKASHGLVEGAAGSRITDVVLVSAGTCSVDAFPALRLRDSGGAALILGPSTGPGAIDLVPGVAYTSNVRVANWCAPDPSFPVSLSIVLGTDELAVTGGSFPEDGDPPPCNGDTGPRLEGTAWTPSP
jgi:Protein of unknown function (DUF4232)